MALVPCDSCRRHVRSLDLACPFCKTVRNVTTMAVVAASAFAIAGCEAISPASKYGGPPAGYERPVDSSSLKVDAPDAAPATPSTPSATPSATSPRLGDAPTEPSGHTFAPSTKYGGPPRR